MKQNIQLEKHVDLSERYSPPLHYIPFPIHMLIHFVISMFFVLQKEKADWDTFGQWLRYSFILLFTFSYSREADWLEVGTNRQRPLVSFYWNSAIEQSAKFVILTF